MSNNRETKELVFSKLSVSRDTILDSIIPDRVAEAIDFAWDKIRDYPSEEFSDKGKLALWFLKNCCVVTYGAPISLKHGWYGIVLNITAELANGLGIEISTNENALEGMRCPKCRSEGPFLIQTMYEELVEDEDGVISEGAVESWRDSAVVECEKCDHLGTVWSFTIENKCSEQESSLTHKESVDGLRFAEIRFGMFTGELVKNRSKNGQ